MARYRPKWLNSWVVKADWWSINRETSQRERKMKKAKNANFRSSPNYPRCQSSKRKCLGALFITTSWISVMGTHFTVRLPLLFLTLICFPFYSSSRALCHLLLYNILTRSLMHNFPIHLFEWIDVLQILMPYFSNGQKFKLFCQVNKKGAIFRQWINSLKVTRPLWK